MAEPPLPMSGDHRSDSPFPADHFPRESVPGWIACVPDRLASEPSLLFCLSAKLQGIGERQGMTWNQFFRPCNEPRKRHSHGPAACPLGVVPMRLPSKSLGRAISAAPLARASRANPHIPKSSRQLRETPPFSRAPCTEGTRARRQPKCRERSNRDLSGDRRASGLMPFFLSFLSGLGKMELFPSFSAVTSCH